MSDRILAIAFFIPKTEVELTIEELLEKAQAKNITFSSPNEFKSWSGTHCEWSEFIDGLASIHELENHRLLHITFSQSQLLGLLPPRDCSPPIEEDPTLPVALTFKKACETLLPDVGLIATHDYDAQLEWILEREWMVLAMDATSLADEGFGLLYLNEDISTSWIHHPLRDDRDSLPIDNGLLVFSSKGRLRWF